VTPLAYAALDLYAGNFAAHLDGYVLDSHIHKSEPITVELLEWAFLDTEHSDHEDDQFCHPFAVPEPK
jgi:hypothetical protein